MWSYSYKNETDAETKTKPPARVASVRTWKKLEPICYSPDQRQNIMFILRQGPDNVSHQLKNE